MPVNTKDIKIQGASLTLWLEDVPQYKEHKTAAIGNFFAEDIKAGKKIILQQLEELKKKKYTYVIGPMNGSTWKNYRFIIESDGSDSFFMEPTNKIFYPKIFEDCGFIIVGEYCSARTTNLEYYSSKKIPEGITILPFKKNEALSELKKIWSLSKIAFSNNFLYTPIDLQDFINIYMPVIDKINEEYFLMSYSIEKDLIGFIFSIPDYLQGNKPNQLIIKTYASMVRGVGGAMVDYIHEKAQRDGYKSVVHALMHDQNVSKKHSEKYSHTFRRYALFGKELK